jgi:GR25 family glycosyltransferase involved in LPS biosynthesis
MKIEEFFDAGYYINLDRRTDRKQQFEEEVSKLNLIEFFKRFSGVEANIEDIDPDDQLRISYRKHGACGESHVNIIKQAIERNLNNVVIFEDDIKLYDDGPESSKSIIESGLDTLYTIPDWDIVYFGAIIKDFEVKAVGKNLVKAEGLLTTHAWGINSTIFHKFLNYKPNNGSSPDFDGPIDSCFGNDSSLNKYVINPLTVYQRCDTLSDCNAQEDANIFTTDCVGPWLANYSFLILT